MIFIRSALESCFPKVPIFVNPKAKLFWNFKMEFQVQNRIESQIIYRNLMSFEKKFLRVHYSKFTFHKTLSRMKMHMFDTEITIDCKPIIYLLIFTIRQQSGRVKRHTYSIRIYLASAPVEDPNTGRT